MSETIFLNPKDNFLEEIVKYAKEKVFNKYYLSKENTKELMLVCYSMQSLKCEESGTIELVWKMSLKKEIKMSITKCYNRIFDQNVFRINRIYIKYGNGIEYTVEYNNLPFESESILFDLLIQ